ncbi:MAG: YebC/PmpR family DNA-binding transcriptional regulator [Anaerolineaceae bacterium]|jgi:YebC/PmpR family DNA-binding regulatory protein|nr:YebC/PmpR family DNA-binding transcriptional regulator [Anaerolineaceae bacterium]
MSGHSKWSTIKRKKGAADAKRGKIFTRVTREILTAAKDGGSDLSSNVRLRLAVDKAKAVNMPKDNIERAIKRGSGESKEGSYDEVMYEGYGPHGIAIMIECLTENRNRTVAEVRHILNRANGTMGEQGSVSWQFNRVAYFAFPCEGNDFDKVFEIALEGGADDVSNDGETIEIIGAVENFKSITDLLVKSGISPEENELRMIPNQEIELDIEQTVQVMKVLDALEELDDVVNVFSNLKITEEAMEAME